MEISSDELYFVDFGDERGKHLAVGEKEVADLLVEEMEDPRQFYRNVLDKGPENVEDPGIIKVSVSDLLEMNPTFQHMWTFKLLPTRELFFGDRKDGNQE